MKTRVNILVVLFTAILMHVQADEIKFKMQEEAFINDIPFNTAVIAVENAHGQLFGFDLNLQPEGYIDDIPFDTKEIADTVVSETMLQTMPQLEDESYIDDIPFNTFEVVNSLNNL